MDELVQEPDRRGRLEDLKRERHVGDAGHAGQEALEDRIRGVAARVVGFLLFQRRGQVGDLVAVDDALTRGHTFFSGMILDVEPRAVVHHLPEAGEIRLAVRSTWNGSRRRLYARLGPR